MAQAVRIGKKTYAVGLSWGPLDPEKPLRPQAIEKARQSKNGLYVIYGEIEPHVGHCDVAIGVKAGLPVLAPLVAEIWPANTLIAATLGPDKAVGFQIMNGLIYDDVVGSPDDVRSWFDGLAGEHPWDHVSTDWGAAATGSRAFEESLRDQGAKTPRLRSINEGRRIAIKVGALVVAVLSVFLAWSEIVQHRREMAARLAMLSRHVVRTVVPPARIVPIGPFVAACRDALTRIPAFPAGWNVRTVSCRPDRTRIVWERTPGESGTVRDLESALGRPVRLTDSDRARSDFPIEVPEYGIPVDRLPEKNEEKKDLVSVLERYGLSYSLDAGSALAGGAPDAEDGFSVELPVLPDSGLLAALSAVDGLSVLRLERTGGSQWILKGELKHAPIDFNRNRPGSVPGPGKGPGPGGKSGHRGPVGNRQPGPLSGSPPDSLRPSQSSRPGPEVRTAEGP